MRAKILYFVILIFAGLRTFADEVKLYRPQFGEFTSSATREEAKLNSYQAIESESELAQIIQALPKGLIENKEVIILTSSSAEAMATQYLLDQQGINPTVLDLSLISKIIEHEDPSSKLMTQLKNWWDQRYTFPTKSEKHWGIVSGLSRGVIAGSIWFSVGIDPVLATAIVIGQAFVEYLNNTYIRTLENIFENQFLTNSESAENRKQSGWKSLQHRLLYSAMWAYIWRGIGGATQTMHSVTTLQGNFEIISNILSKGLSGSYWGTQKAQRLSRNASGTVGAQSYLLGSILTSLDLAGVSFHTWHFNLPTLGIIHEPLELVISASTLSIIGFYTSLAATAKFKPHLLENYVKAFDNLVAKINNAKPKLFKKKMEANVVSCSELF